MMDGLFGLVFSAVYALVEFVFYLVVHLVFWVVVGSVWWLMIATEFIYLVFAQGKFAALERYRERSRTLSSTLFDDVDPNKERSWWKREASTPNLKETISGLLGVLVVIAIAVAIWRVYEGIEEWRLAARRARIAETRGQVTKLADGFLEQLKDAQQPAPQPGMLPEQDAWDQPMRLLVELEMLGTKRTIIVESSGPDQEFGSSDDIRAKGSVPVPAKEIGKKVLDRGITSIRERVKKLLPGEGEQETRDVDGQEK